MANPEIKYRHLGVLLFKVVPQASFWRGISRITVISGARLYWWAWWKHCQGTKSQSQCKALSELKLALMKTEPKNKLASHWHHHHFLFRSAKWRIPTASDGWWTEFATGLGTSSGLRSSLQDFVKDNVRWFGIFQKIQNGHSPTSSQLTLQNFYLLRFIAFIFVLHRALQSGKQGVGYTLLPIDISDKGCLHWESIVLGGSFDTK